MLELTMQQIFTRLVAILLIVATHGLAVVHITTILGDRGPEHDGRRTVNPFAHLDIVGGLGLLLFGFGWMRPVNVDPRELRSPRRDLVLIAAAGYVAVILLGLLVHPLRSAAVAALPAGPGIAVASILGTTATLSVWFVLFNLLPLPPLTGRYLGYALLPTSRVLALERFTLHFSLGLALLIVIGVIPSLLVGPFRSAVSAIFG